MAKVIGIDLGTTNSVVAVMEGGKPQVIINTEGSRLTPSVAGFTKNGERLVGELAKRQAVTNPDRTVVSIKREMGTSHRVRIDNKDYTPEEISGMILQKLKGDAERYLGETIKKALAMGCDRGVHVQDPTALLKDPWQIAGIIAAVATDKGFDLIFTGMQSQDRGSAQVGVLVAELLGISCATTLVGFAYEDGTVTARRELEGGIKGVVKLKLPALVTCQLGLNVPRYPTLPNIMKAKKKELVVIPVQDLLPAEPIAETTKFYPPARKGSGLVLEGDVPALVDQVIGILKEKTTILR